MDDFTIRKRRFAAVIGHPNKPVSYGPAFDWPPNPRALFKWFFGFPGYLVPVERFVCRRGDPDLDVSDALARND